MGLLTKLVTFMLTFFAVASLAHAGGTMPLGGDQATVDAVSTISAHGVDGTLPLRVGGDGTLPLMLSGDATADLTNKMPAQLVIVQANTVAIADPTGTLVPCKLSGPKVSHHTATGHMLIASALYQVVGICYDADAKTMEVVAEHKTADGVTERSFMAGGLATESPSTFAGQLVLVSADKTTGHYTFALESAAK